MTSGQKVKLKRVLERGRSRAIKLIRLSEKFRASLEESEAQELARINNVLEFIALYDFEFSCLFEDLIEHQESLRGNVYARHLILLIYETSEKLRHLLGKQFQEDIMAIGYSEESINTVRSVLKCFNDAFKRCKREFGDVRHGVAAHRDQSAAEQLRLLRGVHPEGVAKIALQMENCVLALHDIMLRHSRNLRSWIESSS